MKKILWMVLSCVLCFTTGCQSTTQADASATAAISVAENEAAAAVNTLELTDHMQMIKNRIIQGSFFSGDQIYSDACVYMSTEDKADTVGVFFVTDMELAMTDLQDYLSVLSTQVNQYDATELFKISNAVLANNENDKIVLIIASDIEAAKKIANKLLS